MSIEPIDISRLSKLQREQALRQKKALGRALVLFYSITIILCALIFALLQKRGH